MPIRIVDTVHTTEKTIKSQAKTQLNSCDVITRQATTLIDWKNGANMILKPTKTGEYLKKVSNLKPWLGKITEKMPYILLSGFERSPEFLRPTGNSLRFAEEHGHRCFFHAEEKRWYRYDGKVWQRADIGMMRLLARETATKIAEHDQTNPALLDWQKKSLCKAQLDEMIVLAEGWLQKNQADLDRDPYLFNVLNGTINLRTGRIRPHDANDFITMIAEVVFDPKAKCPTFDKFMDNFTVSNPDLVEYLKRWAGYFLTGDTSERKMLTLVGNGANGKGTFIDTCKVVLGSYAKTVQAESLMQTKFASGAAASPDLARLVGARAAFVSEGDRSHKLNEALIKQISGQDTLTARALYGSPFEYLPQFKFIFQTNYLPKIRGLDDGIWWRQAVVKCLAHFPPDKMDKDLRKKLAAEASGILNWMLQGALEWQQNGLAPEPQVVKKAVEQYRIDSDNVTRFLLENTRRDSNAKILKTALYAQYKQWTEEEGEQYTATSREFNQIVEGLAGVSYKKTNKGHFWQGIEIGSEPEPDEASIPEDMMELFLAS